MHCLLRPHSHTLYETKLTICFTCDVVYIGPTCFLTIGDQGPFKCYVMQ